MEGRRQLLRAAGQEGPDVGIGREPGDVQGEELVVPEELVPRQR